MTIIIEDVRHIGILFNNIILRWIVFVLFVSKREKEALDGRGLMLVSRNRTTRAWHMALVPGQNEKCFLIWADYLFGHCYPRLFVRNMKVNFSLCEGDELGDQRFSLHCVYKCGKYKRTGKCGEWINSLEWDQASSHPNGKKDCSQCNLTALKV